MSAKTVRRNNAKHDPSRNKSPQRIGDFNAGGAPTRREQLPEPEQITSENWRLLADNPPKKGTQEPPSETPTDQKMGFTSRRAYFRKSVQN